MYLISEGIHNGAWVVDGVCENKLNAVKYLKKKGLKYSKKYSVYYGFTDKRRSNIYEDSDIVFKIESVRVIDNE